MVIFHCVNTSIILLGLYLLACAVRRHLGDRARSRLKRDASRTPPARQVRTPWTGATELDDRRRGDQVVSQQPVVCWDQPSAVYSTGGGEASSRKLFVAACSLVVVSCLVHQLVLAYALTQAVTDDLCNALVRLHLASSLLALGCQYGVLWMRQRAVYSRHSVASKSCRCTRGCSWTLLVFIVFGLATISVLFLLSTSYEVRSASSTFLNRTLLSCQSLNTSAADSQTPLLLHAPWIATLVYSTVLLFSFFVLLAQPLLLCRVKVSSAPASSARGVADASDDDGAFSVAKRGLVSACACVVSNMAAGVFAFVHDDLIAVMLTLDSSIALNLILCALTFRKWTTHLCLSASPRRCCCSLTADDLDDDDGGGGGGGGSSTRKCGTRDNSCTATRTTCVSSTFTIEPSSQ